MKLSLIFLSFFISFSALSMTLSYKDHVKVTPTVISANLPAHFLKLHRNFTYEDHRMIAGTFETSRRKLSFWDKLRTKFKGQKGFLTF